jgi:hypothetical protein
MSVVVLSGQELKHVPPAAPSFMVLHSFAGPDGANPAAGLVWDVAGNLYATAENGGSSGFGVVFELVRCDSGYDFKVLHDFAGGVFIGGDGANPLASLKRDSAGNLYGTTAGGGAKSRACSHQWNLWSGVRADPLRLRPHRLRL